MKKQIFNNSFGARPGVVALLLLAIVLTSCLFESDDNGLESWLSSQGMPSSYKVQTLSINDLKVASAEVFLDTLPKSADNRAVFGHVSNLTHDLFVDMAFVPDSSFIRKLNESDTSGAFMYFFWLRPFYMAKKFPSDSLPYKEEMNVSIEWKLDASTSGGFIDSIMRITDAGWYESLTEWKPDASADTVFNMHVAAGDTLIRLQLPTALVDSLKKIKGSAHLQLRFSAPEAKHEYRFYGDETYYPPIFSLYSDSTTFISFNPFRMANVVRNEEECSECLVLHGGVYDSLVVELPSERILKALSEFYGDDFPYTKGDKNDVRQTVVLAQLTMARDDSKGSNEFGYPIQVVVGSYVDSADGQIRRMENYRLNDDLILEEGHQNLIFHKGDSLSLQLTYGMRDFLNKASDGRSMKFIMRLGYPFLQEKDTTYSDYVKTWKDTIKTAKGDSIVSRKDTVSLFFSYLDYARYDFTESFEKPMTLKLWLASKRGDEE